MDKEAKKRPEYNTMYVGKNAPPFQEKALCWLSGRA
jgi:hypothetical protein